LVIDFVVVFSFPAVASCCWHHVATRCSFVDRNMCCQCASAATEIHTESVCQSLSERRELWICPPLRGATRSEPTIYRSQTEVPYLHLFLWNSAIWHWKSKQTNHCTNKR